MFSYKYKDIKRQLTDTIVVYIILYVYWPSRWVSDFDSKGEEKDQDSNFIFYHFFKIPNGT